jgi:anti-anti-sigma factor
VERLEASTCVVSPEGDLDMAASRRLRDALRRCLLASTPRCVVDLSKVSLLDASAIRALTEARDQMAARGKKMILARPSIAARRVLEASGSLAGFAVSA